MQEQFERERPIDIDALCDAHPRIAKRLRRVHNGWVTLLPQLEELSELSRDPLAPQFGPANEQPRWLRFLERLEQRSDDGSNYVVAESIGGGSSSDVRRARDMQLDRELAMKIARTSLKDLRDGTASTLERRRLQRFIAEARLTARLDHPGVLPLHSVGLDDDGHLYFTMPLVHGAGFASVIAQARAGENDWNEFRALEVLLRVCDAMEYAHSQLVIHRDLKPDNVLVGRFGETYVVDWGLARVLVGDESTTLIAEHADAQDDGRTLDGDVIGTPSYMPPEQAAGRLDAIDARSDIYSVGAMLYQLLTGRPPYLDGAEKLTASELVARVRRGPPTALEFLAPQASPELRAVCDKAMARERSDRYASMRALAEDLRRHLAHRVVHAYEQGTWAELKKLVRRNRMATAAALVASFSVIFGLIATTLSQTRARRALEVQACAGRLADLRRRANTFGAPSPALVPQLESWLTEARDLRASGVGLRRDLELLRAEALPFEATSRAELVAHAARDERVGNLVMQREGCAVELRQLAERPNHPGAASRMRFLTDEAARLDGATARIDTASRAAWLFADSETQARHEFLAQLVADLDEFEVADPYRAPLAEVEQRLISIRSGSSIDAATWSATLAALEDRTRSPHYDGLRMKPQFGLVPLGEDPRSHLWEFALQASGDIPKRSADGNFVVTDSTALVFVLVPGGQHQRRWKPLRDELPWGTIGAAGTSREGGMNTCRLDPFFISKYEMTQGQWLRLTGGNPSYYHDGTTFGDFNAVAQQPVEQVSWHDASAWLPHWGLALPSEAQWERAAAGGARTRFWWGDDPADHFGRANTRGADFAEDRGGDFPTPVGSFEPNPYGLYDVYGNAWEWTADVFWITWAWPMRDGDGRSLAPESGLRSARGLSFGCDIYDLTNSVLRTDSPPNRPNAELGLRPVRALER